MLLSGSGPLSPLINNPNVSESQDVLNNVVLPSVRKSHHGLTSVHRLDGPKGWSTWSRDLTFRINWKQSWKPDLLIQRQSRTSLMPYKEWVQILTENLQNLIESLLRRMEDVMVRHEQRLLSQTVKVTQKVYVTRMEYLEQKD